LTPLLLRHRPVVLVFSLSLFVFGPHYLFPLGMVECAERPRLASARVISFPNLAESLDWRSRHPKRVGLVLEFDSTSEAEVSTQ
jgi:hypothetical protein